MNDSLIYPCLTHLMKILDQKEGNKSNKKSFYHANLILSHFLEGRILFNQQAQMYKVFRDYYRQRWMLNSDTQTDQTDSCLFLRELQKENQTDRCASQIVVRLLIVGIESLLNMEMDERLFKEIVHLYENMRLALVFQSLNITDILIFFTEKLTNQIKNLLFYESLLKIFNTLDNYKLSQYLEKLLHDFRQEWKKNQQQIKANFTTKKKNRQSIFLPSPKRNVSLAHQQKIKLNTNLKENVKQIHKSKEKQTQIAKSSFKLIKTPKIPQQTSRKSVYHGKMYQFNSRTSTNDFLSSIQSISFEETKHSEIYPYKILSQSNLNYSSFYCPKIQQKEEGILADSTPEKRKKMNRKI